MFRKALFWTHLACGILAGIVVFTMSITGVILMYERQMNQWAAERHYVPAAEQGERLPLEQLMLIQRTRQPEAQVATLVVTNHPGAPVAFRAGRSGGVSLNPYTGEEMETGSPTLDNFFNVVTGFHRWFNIEGEHRALAREITGVSNVIFLFLVISGMYLWLPSLWKWGLFKARLWLRSDYADSKTRDFHWHHVFGIWSAIPLIAVVYTGAVISYPWAANFMYTVFGAEAAVAAAPPQGQARGDSVGTLSVGSAAVEVVEPPRFLPLDTLLERAIVDSRSAGWQRMNVTLPRIETAPTLQIEVDKGNGAQIHKRHTLSIDRGTGEITAVSTFDDAPEQTRLRNIARFLHTGEVLGFWGQTIAGLVSFFALFMVWTGFALSWRRLIQPLFNRNK